MAVLGKKQIKLYTEVCADDISRSSGLMFRKYLGSNHGVLFCFSSESIYPFWMKNTYLPLDIIFSNSDGVIVDIKDMKPLSTAQTKSSEPFKYALEVNRGWAESHSVEVGSHIFGDIKTARAVENNWLMLAEDFKTAVDVAYRNHWDLVVTYMFRPVTYNGKREIHREVNKPTVQDYHLLLNGSVKLKNGKLFEYRDSGHGEFIVVPCSHSSGDPRCFFIDGIVDYRYSLNGRTFIDPREIEVVKKKKKKVIGPGMAYNPALEGIPSVLF